MRGSLMVRGYRRPFRWPCDLRQHLLEELSATAVEQRQGASGGLVFELLDVETELVANGRQPVGGSDDVFDGLVAELVGGAVRETAFEAASSHPLSESKRVVIPAHRFRVFVV